MSNKFDFGSMPVRGGFIAFYRMVHHSKNFVLRDGAHDIIFATAAEAREAAGEAFKAYLNSPIGSATFDTATPKKVQRAAAEKLFRGGGKVIEVERRRMPA
ncbi:hypothetical protein HGP16_25420 [Rhizobium sp. P40RR-XXII]|uniref:hypothetical protein n=1 Tax=Rhizobium sp. P40RR-XXII TaxID=2726739 RepID=UPI0014574344|nr:hypothetical protein [Rhizobium sp. P40RR-XXII]NLS19883.1 hypothetical protein [Rhizobium sp. P40RR-XXII]